MLVLSRKLDQRIFINDGESLVIVQVVDINHERVRLGILAHPHVRIDREEIRFAKDRDSRTSPAHRQPHPGPPRFPTKDLSDPQPDGSPDP